MDPTDTNKAQQQQRQHHLQMLLAQEGRPSAQPQLGRQQQQQQQQQQQNQQQQQLQQQTRLVAARALPPQPQGSVAGDASVGGRGARLTGVAGMTTSSHLVGCFASQVTISLRDFEFGVVGFPTLPALLGIFSIVLPACHCPIRPKHVFSAK